MAHEPRVLVAGETLIDFLPERPGPLEDVSGFDRRPGGAPANVAVALATLEERPALWTRLGDDPFGRYLEDTLTHYGLPETFIERDPDANTSLAFVTHDMSGDREFTFYRDDTADTRMTPGQIPEETLTDLEWVHVGGVALSSGSSRAATLDLLERAMAAGCTISFDPNARAELWPDEETFRRVCGEALAFADICKATVEELETLGFAEKSGTSPEPVAIAESVLEFGVDGGPHTVFVTRGGEGAIATSSPRAPWASDRNDTTGDADPAAEIVEHGGFEVDVVDTTGAGDAFVAGTIAGLLEDRSLESTLVFANAVAAQTTTDAGAMTALPTPTEAESLIQNQSSTRGGL